MGMTINEIIAKETEIVQEFQKVIDTHMVSEDMLLEEMYCDDTEVIEEHLQRCKVFADYHNQIVETMRNYQNIQEIVKQKDYDRFNSHNYYGYFLRVQDIKKVIEDGRT